MMRKILISIFMFVASATITAVNADTLMMLSSPEINRLGEKPNPYATLTYDEKDYVRAYKVFLANGKIEDAFFLAKHAVEQRPNDDRWRQNFIQAALWLGQNFTALQQLSFLALQKKQPTALEEAIKIGNKIGANYELIPLLQLKLKQQPHDINAVLQLASAYDGSGHPEAALSFLREETKINSLPAFLTKAASIYQNLGDTQDELNTLTKLNQMHAASVVNIQRLAELYYSQGKIQQAMEVMQTMSNSTPVHDAKFWRTLGELSWMTGSDPIATEAYTNAYKFDGITFQQEHLRRLVLLLQNTAPVDALRLAMQGWQRYHALGFYLPALTLSMQLKNWGNLQILERSLSAEQRASMYRFPSYWQANTLLIEHTSGAVQARQYLARAVLHCPELTDLKAMYLNLLLDQFDSNHDPEAKQDLLTALQSWHNTLFATPELWQPYTRAYLFLHKPWDALAIMHYQRPDKLDYLWASRYADVFDQLDWPQWAFATRVFAWDQLMLQLQRGTMDQQLMQVLTQLAPNFCAANITFPLLVSSVSNDNPGLLLSWASANHEDELASYLVNYYYPEHAPAWATFSLALQCHDRATLHKMLTSMNSTVLPAADRIAAAQQLDAPVLEQQFAYEGLDENPNDNPLYAQFVDSMLKGANQFSVLQEYKQFGDLIGPRSKMEAKLHLSPWWTISPYASIWFMRTKDSDQIANPPYFDQYAGIILEQQNNCNHFALNLAERDDLYHFYTVAVSDEYQLTGQLGMGAKIGFNQECSLNELMLAGGVQDELIGNLVYQITPRDTAVGVLEGDKYYTQNRIALGNGFSITGQVNHKLWLSYPDYTLGVFGSVDALSATHSQLHGRILTLIPSGQVPSAGLFINPSFWQTGISFSFGDAVRLSYTHAWRPYASVSLLYDSQAGIGDIIDAGLAGCVMGRDKLMFYVTQSANQQGTQQINYNAGIKYQIYF